MAIISPVKSEWFMFGLFRVFGRFRFEFRFELCGSGDSSTGFVLNLC
ncbi:hypothetical protein Hanom_Chr07g00623811 [Helianthus anomalus]